jgi:hypothetical protein
MRRKAAGGVRLCPQFVWLSALDLVCLGEPAWVQRRRANHWTLPGEAPTRARTGLAAVPVSIHWSWTRLASIPVVRPATRFSSHGCDVQVPMI